MIRDLGALTRREFDVLVIGGGIFGIAAARDAALRGLTTALVERGDFASATSANSFKIVHGGIRYLQHGDLPRIRESSRERRALLRIAPHLVQPLPIVIPTYGRGLTGRTALRAGLAVYDLLAWDRNRSVGDPDRRVPRGRLISRDECLALFPDLEPKQLTGGAIFHDAQMYNPPRLALSCLQSAVGNGAVAANYVEAVEFLTRPNRVYGIRARDVLGRGDLEIRARMVINATGPWAERLVARTLGVTVTPASTFSRDACFVVRKSLLRNHALALMAPTRDPDALVSRGRRHLFIVPWRAYTLIGVWHVVHLGSADHIAATDGELQAFIDEVNAAYPVLHLTLDDVSLCNDGLVLFGENQGTSRDLRYAKRSRIIDHAAGNGLGGLVSVIGVRWTTARSVAEQVVRLVCNRLGRRAPPSTTDTSAIHGGAIRRFTDFMRDAEARPPKGVTPETMRHLARNYGTEYPRVLAYARLRPDSRRVIPGSPVLEAEVVHAVREEMAQTLSDVVFRRTDLGTATYPGDAALERCAQVMSGELGWDGQHCHREITEVRRLFARHRALPAA